MILKLIFIKHITALRNFNKLKNSWICFSIFYFPNVDDQKKFVSQKSMFIVLFSFYDIEKFQKCSLMVKHLASWNLKNVSRIVKYKKKKKQRDIELDLFFRVSAYPNDTGEKQDRKEYKVEIKWLNVLIFVYLHVAGIYGFMLFKLRSTVIIGWVIGFAAGFGTTVGAHRLFTHKTFKANQKLKVFMLILQTISGQHPILQWARDHRVHHKFTDTNADPYNSRRGFFFSHMGWLMCKKHPDVIEQGKKVDMSDLQNDPLVQFQKK